MSKLIYLALLLGLTMPLGAWAQPCLHHDLQVTLYPERHELHVTDTITLPASSKIKAPSGKLTFDLHAGLTLTSATPPATPIPHENGSSGVTRYRVTWPAEGRTVTLKYRGAIFQPPQQRGATYARGFRETPGTIAPEGVYLSASSHWYPQVANHMLTFRLDVQVPEDWEAVSQGERTRHEQRGAFRYVQWTAPRPQETIFLIAAPFTVYEKPAGPADNVLAMAFLRTPDAALAHKYLETTGQYLAMYHNLIGPYPYRKFALVENFWETGYGMPSFTLLGAKVIRLPFILHSSYPHEILHNWWGNGVYTDASDGNWAEGLTAYLADHLIKAQRGAAVAYRRNTLQKYADYVSAAQKDFPLTAFRSRHDPATEAVGYGKTLMLFHMLRQHIGDKAFIQTLQTFFRDFRFKRATFTELLQTFSRVSGIDTQSFFDQWIRRAGAPELQVGDTQLRQDGETFVLTIVLEQVQAASSYALRVPLAITLEGQTDAHHMIVEMAKARQAVTIRLPHRPLRVDVDPQFDLFRRLHREEIPPALSQLFGASNAWIVLPSAAPEAIRQGYEQLAAQWQRRTPLEVRWDRDLDALPTDRAVWLFGWENRWRGHITNAVIPYPVTFETNRVDLATTVLTRDAHTVVLTARHPGAPEHALGWLGTDHPAALPGLGRKLPHYGKYSYLGFSGNEPTNMAKGQWPVLQSPMTVRLPQADGRPAQVARAKLQPHPPLATLPPVFSAERMRRIVDFLASDAQGGRGFGSPELDRAAAFIESQFRDAGLQPGGDKPDSYLQAWPARGGDPEREVTLKNVVGVIPGIKPEWQGQSVVVGAHYDHLGLGWPDAHQGEIGKIRHGADDNASGVAVLIELARRLNQGWQPKRTVVFVAFSGEEAGRLGSKHYVAAARRWPARQSIGMINFDTVGRLGRQPLQVLGTGSAHEWPHIFRGAGWVTGIPIKTIADDWGASDQRSFIDAGIPGVQLFSGAHLDIHRPINTPDKIDVAGLVRVATVAREAIVYLAGRPDPLSAQLSAAADPASGSATTSRRVRLGTVPDFAHAGPATALATSCPIPQPRQPVCSLAILLSRSIRRPLTMPGRSPRFCVHCSPATPLTSPSGARRKNKRYACPWFPASLRLSLFRDRDTT